jgi:Rad3-related DNA helicase
MKLNKPLIEYFPDGFTPRPHQVKGLSDIEVAINKGAKFIIVQAPTGSGKSFISKTLSNTTNICDVEYQNLVFNYYAFDEDYAGAVSRLPAHGLFALTTTKVLQNQYKELFDSSSIFKGKSNYQCKVDESFTTEHAPCVISPAQKKQCWEEHCCPYYEARNSALIEKFTVLNYASFFNLPKHLKKRQIIVADECSELEDEIVKYYSATIDYRRLTVNNIEFEKLTSETPAKALGWLTDIAEKVKETIEAHKGRARYENNKIELIKQQFRKDLYDSIINIIDHWDKTQYIIEKDAEKATFTPLKIDTLSHCLFDYADVIVLMSATIVDKNIFAKSLGIKQFEYIEIESTFDPKKSPIYCHSKYPLNYKTLDTHLPQVVELANTISDVHKGEKGIIHTHSFVITQAVQKKLKNKRFLYREEGTTNETIIKEHTLRKDDTVLVSPSLTMGLDLKGDLGKWQIVIKMPYPSLASKRVKKLFEIDPGWYKMKMFISLIQACGRCTRSAEDESVTYILDGVSAKTILENRKILPKHFLDRIM